MSPLGGGGFGLQISGIRFNLRSKSTETDDVSEKSQSFLCSSASCSVPRPAGLRNRLTNFQVDSFGVDSEKCGTSFAPGDGIWASSRSTPWATVQLSTINAMQPSGPLPIHIPMERWWWTLEATSSIAIMVESSPEFRSWQTVSTTPLLSMDNSSLCG